MFIWNKENDKVINLDHVDSIYLWGDNIVFLYRGEEELRWDFSKKQEAEKVMEIILKMLQKKGLGDEV